MEFVNESGDGDDDDGIKDEDGRQLVLQCAQSILKYNYTNIYSNAA